MVLEESLVDASNVTNNSIQIISTTPYYYDYDYDLQDHCNNRRLPIDTDAFKLKPYAIFAIVLAVIGIGKIKLIFY